MPVPRAFHGSAAANGELLVFGGCREDLLCNEGDTIAEVCSYDPNADRWNSRAPMPTPRSRLAVVALPRPDGSTQILTIGGLIAGVEAARTVEIYEAEEDSWHTAPPLPAGTAGPSAAVLDGLVYVIGGFVDGANVWTGERSLQIYDPDAEEWTVGTDPPVGRCRAGAAALGGAMLVVGGEVECDVGYWDRVDVYQPQEGTWAAGTPLLYASQHLACATVGGRLYALGGNGGENLVQVHEPDAEAWRLGTSMPEARAGHAATALEDAIYVTGGDTGQGGMADTLWVMTSQ
jgi:N-acetylneuraminic acid mutarotase